MGPGSGLMAGLGKYDYVCWYHYKNCEMLKEWSVHGANIIQSDLESANILACILVSRNAKSSSQASEQTAMRYKNIHKSNLMYGSRVRIHFNSSEYELR
jgi:hypothetical protein